MPPFIGMADEPFFRHHPMQQAAIGAGFLIGETHFWIAAFEMIAMGDPGHVIEQRSHPELFAADPAQGEIARGTRCMRGGRMFIGGGRAQ